MATVQIIQSENGGEPQFIVDGGRDGYQASASDYVETYDGQTKHIFQDVEIQEPGAYDHAEYESLQAEAIFGSVQNFQAVAAWAQHNVDPSLLADFNSKLETQDGGQIEQALEWLKGEYAESLQREEDLNELDPDDRETVEWYESLDDELIDSTIDAITDIEFDDDQVELMAQLTDNYAQGSVERSILQAGQLIAAGQLDPMDAIETICEQYGEATAAAAYFALQQTINY